MKQNIVSIILLSFLVISLFSCTNSNQNVEGAEITTETTTENAAIPTEETSTEIATNPAFETLLNEFTACEDLDKFLKNESCAETESFTDEEGKTKMEALTAQIFALTPKGATIKVFGRENPLENYVGYEEAPSYSLNSLVQTNWENLVFLSFNVERVSMPIYQTSSTVLVFTKSGEFKGAFINAFEYDQLSSKTCNKVEKTPTSLKLAIINKEESEDGNKTETKIGFYQVDKNGTVTYTQK
jgi:hypothetical protein